MILNYLLLPVFFFIGLITSYEDIRRGKIGNKWIILGFGWGLAVYFFLFIFSSSYFGLSLSFLWKSFLNSFIALLLAFLMWRVRGWSAGDAKLFFVFSLLIPVVYYRKSYLPIFPSFALLINIFVPLLLFLFFKSCFYLFRLKTQGIKILKGFIVDKSYWITSGALLSGFLGLILFFGFLWTEIGKYFFIGNIFFLQTLFFAALIIFLRSSGIFSKKTAVIKIAFLFFPLSTGYGFIFAPHLTWQILSRAVPWMVIFMVALGLFRKLLIFYVSSEEREGRRAFPMAIWIFLGGILTLILKESVLSSILKYIFS